MVMDGTEERWTDGYGSRTKLGTGSITDLQKTTASITGHSRCSKTVTFRRWRLMIPSQKVKVSTQVPISRLGLLMEIHKTDFIRLIVIQ